MITMHLLKCQVLIAAGTKKTVFCVIAPCSLVEIYRRFRGACYLHHQAELHGATSKKAVTFITHFKNSLVWKE
jgi:hypothetical protein